MCFKSFSSSVKGLIILCICGYLSVVSFYLPAENPACHDESALQCINIGSAEVHRNALSSVFRQNHVIDLIFVICNTTDCTKAYAAVIEFIKKITTLISAQYESYIDADRLHVAIIVYDNTSVRVTLNDIAESIPKVGNCEFNQFLDTRMNSIEARGGASDGLLVESLVKAKEVFSPKARPNATKVLWLFSECGYCKSNAAKRYAIENTVGDIKSSKVVIFTAGICWCDIGYFVTLVQEDTMKAIATTNSSHYACLESWVDFVNMEISAAVGDATPHWSDIGEGADDRGRCRDCAGSTSSHRCACQVVSKEYECHDLPPRPSTSKSTPHAPLSLPASIGLGAGIGGGLFIVIIIVIIVVAARRWKKPGPLPPPVPRRYQPPASPPVSKHRIYENPDQTPGLIPTEWQTTAIDDTESIESLEYEVQDVERNMSGWSAHLLALKRKDCALLHLGVYSIGDDYFAQTPGFTLTESQRMAFNDAMTTGNSVRNLRKKATVIVGGTTYVIERKTREKLRARTADKKLWLAAVSRSGYLVVGLAEAEGRDRCEEVIEDVICAVTASGT